VRSTGRGRPPCRILGQLSIDREKIRSLSTTTVENGQENKVPNKKGLAARGKGGKANKAKKWRWMLKGSLGVFRKSERFLTPPEQRH